jgi:hypothetical protein
MNKRKYIQFCLSLVLSLGLVLAAVPVSAQVPPDIKVTVALDDQDVPPTYMLGIDPIRAVITIENLGDDVITSAGFMARDFHLDLVFTDEKGREIRANLGEAENPPLPRVKLVNGLLKQVDPAEIIPAGWTLVVEIPDINAYYTLIFPGVYIAKAVIPMQTYPAIDVVTDSGEEYATLKSSDWAGVLVSDPPTEFYFVGDGDGDTFAYPVSLPPYDPVPDCDDSNPDVYPGQTEIADNGIDDDCDPNTPDHVVLQPGIVNVEATRHVVGGGAKPDTGRFPLEGMDLRLYDSSNACLNAIGTQWQSNDAVWRSCPCPSNLWATTDSAGLASIQAPPGSYFLMGQYQSAVSGTLYVTRNVGNLPEAGSVFKKVQIMEKITGKQVATKTTIMTGSELLIIEPEYVEWDGTEELYPFVFETLGDWTVTTSVQPPEGFVSDYESLSEEVVTESEAVQFTITDIGSEWVDTEVTYLVDHKGKKEKIKSKIGIKCSEKLAKEKNFDKFCQPKDKDKEK